MKNRLGRLLWNVTFLFLVRWTPPRLAMPWRKLVLRLFGARLGRTWIHPSVRIWAPWLLTSGNDVFIDRGCQLYNIYGIEIGDRVVISMQSTLCTASHDHRVRDFRLIGERIIVESDCWIAAQAFIVPGVRIGTGSVVGARSVVTKDVPRMTIVAGNPARAVGDRKIEK